jgi:eukaryotic-like serine/threonine-protein kinase
MPDQLSGSVIAHRYRLVRVLGEGGMGRVYEAEDLELKRRVAVKLLHGRLATDPEGTSRLQREARTLARLSHPNIVAVFDSGEDACGRFLVSELVEGHSVEQVMAAGGMVPGQALELVRQLAEALDHAHGQLVVHRDVKPANLLVTPTGIVKVTDFGVAKISSGLTLHSAPGTLIGTPTYSSPEQARGRRVSVASDIYSLGVVAYEVLAGEPPFRGATPVEVGMAHCNEPPPPMPASAAIPTAVQEVIARALAKDPAERPTTAIEFSTALAAEAARSMPVTAAAKLGDPAASASVVTTRSVAAERTLPLPTKRLGRRRLGLLAGASLTVAVLALGTLAAVAADLVGAPLDGGTQTVTEVKRKTVTATVTQTVERPGEVAVPAVVGQRLDLARAALERLGLSPDVSGGGLFGIGDPQRWQVVDQRPGPGIPLPIGSAVKLLVERA